VFAFIWPTSKPALISSRPTRLDEPQQTERVRLGRPGRGIQYRGVKVAREAREAAKHEVLMPARSARWGHSQVREASVSYSGIFREQAEALEERGVDFFILETSAISKSSLRRSRPYVRFRNSRLCTANLLRGRNSFSGARPRQTWTRSMSGGSGDRRELFGRPQTSAHPPGLGRSGGIVSHECNANVGFRSVPATASSIRNLHLNTRSFCA